MITSSNPIFGLNTLGGALAVRTKRGFDFPGVKLEVSGASFGRWTVTGVRGFRGPFDWYLTFNALNQDGWREHSPSDVYQLFTKVGYKTDAPTSSRALRTPTTTSRAMAWPRRACSRGTAGPCTRSPTRPRT